MLNKKVTDLLTRQIQKEFESAYLYLEISIYFQSTGLEGFSQWFIKQADEEIEHGIKILTYLQNWSCEVKLLDIPAATRHYNDYLQPLSEALTHEEKITSSINDIFRVAQESADYRTQEFLSWFIKEQEEEEAIAGKLLDRTKLFGLTPEGLLLLDKEASRREN